MPVKINGSTSGSVTLAAPATGSDVTLTLPGSTMNLGTELASKAATTDVKVKQIVTGSTSTQVSSNSLTYADTGLSATITPTSASNKVLVIVHQNGLAKDNLAATNELRIQLLRASTQINEVVSLGYTATALTLYLPTYSIAYLDSPATTSATTYKTQFKNNTTGGSVYLQISSARSTITLMEVIAS